MDWLLILIIATLAVIVIVLVAVVLVLRLLVKGLNKELDYLEFLDE
jgi:hypothetical protein